MFMKISCLSVNFVNTASYGSLGINKSVQSVHSGNYQNQSSNRFDKNIYGKYYQSPLLKLNLPAFKGGEIPFTGYYGDTQPLKKLFWISTGRNDVYEDEWTKERIYSSGFHKWVNARPPELLVRTPEQVIQSACTITKPDLHYPEIPAYIPSPNYGDKWGRYANYIEINPRLVAKYDGNSVTEGLFGVMKLLPAIPPTAGKSANCIILSQLYPSLYGDGTLDDESLYCVNLHKGISNNLTSPGLFGKMGADEQVKAFNDLAHLLGFKTGIRMPLSAGQLRVQGREFNWFEHEKAFIDACVWAIELGFDSIYFDSGKHVLDLDGYAGIGDLPSRQAFSYVLYKIREQTGRGDLAFIGEKCNDSFGYKELGLTAGTDWGKADNIYSVKHEAGKQAYNGEYAAGPEVSNDNDDGVLSFEDRLNRINSCLWGFDYPENKLPSFMQIHDIFPLSPYINTHESMMHVKKMSGSDAWTDCERHWAGVFNTSDDASKYTENVYHAFENAIRN
jgi:hypothetical protein